jgi:hypothetical protein
MVSTMGLQGFLPWVKTPPNTLHPFSGCYTPGLHTISHRAEGVSPKVRPARSCPVQRSRAFASIISHPIKLGERRDG